jgi:hypothetical protein
MYIRAGATTTNSFEKKGRNQPNISNGRPNFQRIRKKLNSDRREKRSSGAQQWSATSHFLHFESPHIARFFSTLFAAYLLCIARAIGAEPGARIYYYTRFLF